MLAPYISVFFSISPSRIYMVLSHIENRIYKLLGVDPTRGMGWREYFLSSIIVHIFQMSIAFIIFVLQSILPLNPQGFPGLTLDLAFMEVISFATNTNLQHYNGEGVCNNLPNCPSLSSMPGLSYLSQMTAVQFLQFTSAATGLCVDVAMVRGFVSRSQNLGNF